MSTVQTNSESGIIIGIIGKLFLYEKIKPANFPICGLNQHYINNPILFLHRNLCAWQAPSYRLNARTVYCQEIRKLILVSCKKIER